MTKPRFLVDENLDLAIVTEIKRRNRAIDILHVGDAGAPPFRTPDPVILAYCESTGRTLVTDNRKSMPAHVAEMYAEGHRHWGILKVRGGRKADLGGIIEAIELIWALEEAEDYVDRDAWIPL